MPLILGVMAYLVADAADATYPGGASAAFGLSTVQSDAPKEEIAHALDSFAEDSDTWLVLSRVASDGNTVNAKSPLILVPDEPYTGLASDVLETMASNGQIVFRDGQVLADGVARHELSGFVSSVDNLADQIMTSAQQYAQQAVLGAVSIVVTALALGVLVMESARAWAARNRQLIFAKDELRRRAHGHREEAAFR